MRLRRQTCWKRGERSGAIDFQAEIGRSACDGRGWMLKVAFKERCKRKVKKCELGMMVLYHLKCGL
jgi:phosphoribosyl-AMP cyclohydrolase